ncbi:heavy metal translocating P-type ATPase [Wenyingzhuangia sp. IMCC45574]
MATCYHCGDEAAEEIVLFDDKEFCCNGCKTVYQIFSENDLTDFYSLEDTPGATPNRIEGKYNFLSNPKVVEKLLDFKEEDIEIVTLYIPIIHCSSCVWVLENLQKLNSAIVNSRVHFSKKTVQITYKDTSTLQQIVELLVMIGYDPYISLEDGEKTQKKSKKAIYKLAIAGFAFGNTMFLSFPEYFGKPDIWLEQYKPVFSLLMFLFSIPIVCYAGNEYLISAYKGLKKKILNIDVPISIGIVVLFVRSCYEYFTATGQGYFDSLTGLIFFLLLGKFFQKKTYDFLSFERDFKSYFPIAVTTIKNDEEIVVPVNELKVGDVLFVRNQEIVPTDGIVLKGKPVLDYSFVTGESRLISKDSGDKIFAGGKQQGEGITMEVTKTVDQSYLTKLWSQNSYTKTSKLTHVTDTISQYFTIGLLIVTLVAAIGWLVVDRTQIINVVSSILIVACPCALALSAPFALGNVLRVLGKQRFYLKDSTVIERLAQVESLFFDKTGTLTTREKQEFAFVGQALIPKEEALVRSLVKNSNHPLSRTLYQELKGDRFALESFKEIEGKGLQAIYKGDTIKLGSAVYIGAKNNETESRVYVAINNTIKGYFKFSNSYRTNIFKMLHQLGENHAINVLSGDNDAELFLLQENLPKATQFYFNQSPHDKLDTIKRTQEHGKSVLMVGDGLNDAGALLQAEVGIAVAEDVNVFSPASDAIIDAKKLALLPKFIKLCKQSLGVVKISFVLSILYNIIGLYFAISGQLTPLIAAILMPLSSITIVVFVTLATNLLGKRIRLKV